jgi:hypothetical protein
MIRVVNFRADPAASYLDSLPMLDPSDSLLPKLLGAYGARQRRRRARWQLGAGLAAVLVLSCSALLIWRADAVQEPLASTATQPGSHEPSGSVSAVQRLDDLLAQAYAANASDAQLQALSDARARLMAQPHSTSLVQL